MSKLTITLDEQATAKYLAVASMRTAGEVNSDCEPSGPTIYVDISPVFESEAYIMNGNACIELGSASVSLLED
jgi:hypothetical protein